jgi:GNAT superfamily N-acetyltransferase
MFQTAVWSQVTGDKVIRQANKFDKQEIIDLMIEFKNESNIEALREVNNPEYWHRLLDTIIAGAGIIYIEQGKGLIMGIISPSIWCDKTLQLYELAWFVKPEYRNTSLGSRLLKSYLDYGKKLKESGRIKYFTMAKMITSPDIKYERFGFKKLDENWIQ